MTSGQVYSYAFATPATGRYLRVRSTSSPSWISWTEVGAFNCP
jgi:hypothetical protein